MTNNVHCKKLLRYFLIPLCVQTIVLVRSKSQALGLTFRPLGPWDYYHTLGAIFRPSDLSSYPRTCPHTLEPTFRPLGLFSYPWGYPQTLGLTLRHPVYTQIFGFTLRSSGLSFDPRTYPLTLGLTLIPSRLHLKVLKLYLKQSRQFPKPSGLPSDPRECFLAFTKQLFEQAQYISSLASKYAMNF